MRTKIREAGRLFSSLPKSKSLDLNASIQVAKEQKLDTIVVLDDDPTGTQTVHGIPVLTSWSEKAIQKEFEKGTPLFFILTNSRSLDKASAESLAFTIGQRIRQAAKLSNRKTWVISRGDSTLRGHYPEEVDALELGLNYKHGIHFIIPAFIEGGRFTINDIHYVLKEDQLIPAGRTPYAKDKAFGYQSSNLKGWVEEKNEGILPASEVVSISLKDIRTLSLEKLTNRLNQLEPGTVCIVNAAAYTDLKTFTLALLRSSVQPVLRTAASFVASIAAQKSRRLLTAIEITPPGERGGLIVVGSYVPTTSQQLNYLFQKNSEVVPIEINVRKLLAAKKISSQCQSYSERIDKGIAEGKTVVMYTSRELISALTAEENLQIGQRISRSITKIVKNISVQPKYILTKGGITSSDIATKSLGVERVIAQGQIINGVTVWKLGTETKFPGLSQIIFPGNVGSEKSLAEIIDKLAKG